MTKLLRLINVLQTSRGTRDIRYGDVEAPFEMAMNHDIAARTITIAAEGTAELFDGAETDPFTTASVIWIASDRDCVAQLTFDTTGTYGKEVITMAIKGSGEAGVMGPPLLLADAQAYANYTEDFAAGTLVYCDRVTVKNTDTTNSAIVEFFIGD